MAGLSILALVFIGWRKTARAVPQSPRAEPKLRRPRVPIGIAEATVPLYKPPHILRRIASAIASLGLSVIIGVIGAIVIAFGTAYVVITLTDLLKS